MKKLGFNFKYLTSVNTILRYDQSYFNQGFLELKDDQIILPS
jgi:hypothetical protein